MVVKFPIELKNFSTFKDFTKRITKLKSDYSDLIKVNKNLGKLLVLNKENIEKTTKSFTNYFNRLKKGFNNIGGQVLSVVTFLSLLKKASSVFTLAWQENVGGIQTAWITFVGNLLNTFAKIEISMRRALRQFDGLFKILGSGFFTLLKGVLDPMIFTMKIFVGLLHVIGRISKTIFPTFNKDGSTSSKILSGLVRLTGVFLGILLTTKIATLAYAGAIKSLTIAKVLWTAITGKLTIAQIALNTAMLLNPAVAIVSGIVVLIGAIVLLERKYKIFSNSWKSISKGLVTTLSPIVSLIQFIIKGIQTVSSFLNSGGGNKQILGNQGGSGNVNNTNINKSQNITINANNSSPNRINGIKNMLERNESRTAYNTQ